MVTVTEGRYSLVNIKHNKQNTKDNAQGTKPPNTFLLFYFYISACVAKKREGKVKGKQIVLNENTFLKQFIMITNML